MSTPDAPLLRPADVAAWLAVSRSTLEGWRREGRGPAFIRLPSGSVRYSRAAVVAWLTGDRQAATAD